MAATRTDLRTRYLRTVALALAVGCSGSGTQAGTSPTTPSGNGSNPIAGATPASTQAKGNHGLDKLMRTRMNKSYTQLVFFILDSAIDVDMAKIETETAELQSAVGAVRSLPLPGMVQSEEAKEVYVTYNDVLQRDADKFAVAVKAGDRPQMETMLTKIGKTCNDCHRFFRVDVTDAKK